MPVIIYFYFMKLGFSLMHVLLIMIDLLLICKYGIIPIRYDFAVQLEISKWDVSYNEKFTIFTLMPQVLKFTRLKSHPLLVYWRKISFVAVRLAQYSCKIIAGFQADPRTLQQLGTPHNRFWLMAIHKNFGKIISGKHEFIVHFKLTGLQSEWN